MKKVLSILAVTAFVFAFSSCKKSGSCTCEFLGTSTTQEYEDLDKDEYDQVKTACESSGICTWAD